MYEKKRKIAVMATFTRREKRGMVWIGGAVFSQDPGQFTRSTRREGKVCKPWCRWVDGWEPCESMRKFSSTDFIISEVRSKVS